MRTTRFAILILTLAIVAVTAGDVMAQGRGGGRGGFGGGRGGFGRGGFGGGRGGPGGGVSAFQLVQIEEVQKELDLIADQIAGIEKANETLAEQRGERPDFRNMSDDERNEYFTKTQQQQEEMDLTVKMEILLPDQSSRLDQIILQIRGLAALTSDDIVAKLSITDDQKTQFETIQEERQTSIQEKFQEARDSGDFAAMGDATTKIGEEADEKMLAVLTTEQKTQFEEMKGKAFQMPQRGRGGFGGRRGGGGGFGGGGGRGRGGRGGGRGGRGGRRGGGGN